MKLRPLADKVVVKAYENEETTKGGLIIPSAAKEKPEIAEVIACGPGGNAGRRCFLHGETHASGFARGNSW